MKEITLKYHIWVRIMGWRVL